MNTPTNPSLSPLSFLVGEWKTVGTHPHMPGAELHGEAKYEWIEDGAFLMMHAHVNDERFPKGVAIFGSDDATGDYYMLYFDDRGVSRKYDVTLHANGFAWTRESREFSQRFKLSRQGDGTLVAQGEMSRNGGAWEPDLSQIYAKMGRS